MDSRLRGNDERGMFFTRLALVFIIVLGTTSCASEYKYTPKTSAEIPATIKGAAILNLAPPNSGEIAISRINDNYIADTHLWIGAEAFKKIYTVSPGYTKVSFVIRIKRNSPPTFQFRSVSFDAEPGQNYFFDAESDAYDSTITVMIKDDSGKPVILRDDSGKTIGVKKVYATNGDMIFYKDAGSNDINADSAFISGSATEDKSWDGARRVLTGVLPFSVDDKEIISSIISPLTYKAGLPITPGHHDIKVKLWKPNGRLSPSVDADFSLDAKPKERYKIKMKNTGSDDKPDQTTLWIENSKGDIVTERKTVKLEYPSAGDYIFDFFECIPTALIFRGAC